MAQAQYTTKRGKFQHLTKEKRAQIEILLRQKLPKTQIAKMVGISRSTLYLELSRGMLEQLDSELRPYRRYFWDIGQRVYEHNRENSRPPLKLIKAQDFIRYAEKRILEDRMAPDPLCGQAKRNKTFDEIVCTKTLYNYIDQGLLKVRNIDLPLRTKRKIKTERTRKNRRLYGTSIEERPAEIATREEFGHWEIDTVLGNSSSCAVLLTLDERMTRKRHIIKISERSTAAVAEGLKRIQVQYGEKWSSVFRTITSDNGSEFAALPALLPKTKIYYAHPYSAWERGTNEKQNSLIRRFIPKGRSFEQVSEETILRIQNWINNLPRKIFGYLSADQLFHTVLFDIAI